MHHQAQQAAHQHLGQPVDHQARLQLVGEQRGDQADQEQRPQRPQLARDALIGRWNGPKGIALPKRLIKASGVELRA